MIRFLNHKLKIAWAVAAVTYKEWAAYRTHSMVSIFVGPVYYLVQIFIWTAIYTNRAELHGLGLNELLRYYGAAALIGYLTMDFADWNLQMLIRTGKYLNFALKPMNHRFFALSQKLGHRTLGLLYEFLPVALIFVFVFRVPLEPANWLFTALSVAFSFLINFYVNYSIGLTGFWFTQTGGLRSVYSLLLSVFSGALIPLAFFPQVVQDILVFLPFQYITYVPAMLWTGSTLLAGKVVSPSVLLLIQGAYVLLAFFLSELLSYFGHKRFSGVGA